MNAKVVDYFDQVAWESPLWKTTTPGAVARACHVTISTVYLWINTGKIVARQVGGEGGQWIISVDSVLSFRGDFFVDEQSLY